MGAILYKFDYKHLKVKLHMSETSLSLKKRHALEGPDLPQYPKFKRSYEQSKK